MNIKMSFVCAAIIGLFLGFHPVARASIMTFTMNAELDAVQTVDGSIVPVSFDWNRMDGVLTGDPTVFAGPNVLDCFDDWCEISTMVMDFYNGETSSAHFEFVLADPPTQTFSGLMNDTYPVYARLIGFVYDIVNGECSGRSDVFCWEGFLGLGKPSEDFFLGFTWLGFEDGVAPGAPSPIVFDAAGDGCDGGCLIQYGRFDVNAVDEPAGLPLLSLALLSLLAARPRRLGAES